jgi:hypothetical protein
MHGLKNGRERMEDDEQGARGLMPAGLSEEVSGAGPGAREPGRVLGEFAAARAHGLGIWSSGMILA